MGIRAGIKDDTPPRLIDRDKKGPFAVERSERTLGGLSLSPVDLPSKGKVPIDPSHIPSPEAPEGDGCAVASACTNDHD